MRMLSTRLSPPAPGGTAASLSLVVGPQSRQGAWLREELLHLLSLSGTLAGLCITGVTLVHTFGRSTVPETIADDALAVSSLLFLVCTYTIFLALRTKRPALAHFLENAADILFLLAITGMVVSGFIMVYTGW